MLLSAVSDNHHWVPGIGDPSILGWVTVVAYFGTALLCLGCARLVNDRVPQSWQQQHRYFWLTLALILAFLGVNKQLDLQSLLTVIGRQVLNASGLDSYKRTIQALFLLGLALLGIVSYGVAIRQFRWLYQYYRLAFLGLAFLLVFILARATSFHHFDQFIGLRILGLRMNWILELGGISCVALSAGKLLYRAIKRPA